VFREIEDQVPRALRLRARHEFGDYDVALAGLEFGGDGLGIHCGR
jgi:hypothetical protein